MPDSQSSTVTAGPSVVPTSHTSNGSAAQPQPDSRRNSFDIVIEMANAPAANDTSTGTTTATQPGVSSSIPTYMSPRTPARSTRRAALCNQVDDFEDIELQEWPTASRLAALNSAIAVNSADVDSTPQCLQAQMDAEPSLWQDVIMVFGATRSLFGTKK